MVLRSTVVMMFVQNVDEIAFDAVSHVTYMSHITHESRRITPHESRQTDQSSCTYESRHVTHISHVTYVSRHTYDSHQTNQSCCTHESRVCLCVSVCVCVCVCVASHT